jgi:hypothetical protein
VARNAEARIQASVVAWVRLVAPQVLCFAVPNGGLRTKAEAALMRWTGVVAGIPDLVLVFPGGRCAFWEIKTGIGKLSLAQEDMLARLDDMDVPYAIIRSIDDARRDLHALGISTREHAEAAA